MDKKIHELIVSNLFQATDGTSTLDDNNIDEMSSEGTNDVFVESSSVPLKNGKDHETVKHVSENTTTLRYTTLQYTI